MRKLTFKQVIAIINNCGYKHYEIADEIGIDHPTLSIWKREKEMVKRNRKERIIKAIENLEKNSAAAN